MSSTFFGITFLNSSAFFWVLIAFLVGSIGIWYRFNRRKKLMHALVGERTQELLIKYHPYIELIKLVFLMLGLLFFLSVFLRPAWGKKEEHIEQEGRDVFIAVDVSRSMLAQDFQPDRLNFAKQKIKRLLHKLKAERIGLILFSGSTIVQCPLTTDYAAFQLFLDQLDAETISSGTTSLDQAIKKALEIFESMPEKKHKLLVVFTDGEDFSSNLAGVKQRAIEQGLTIFTLGIGTNEGAPIPLYDQHGNKADYQKDNGGNIVVSRLNEGILHALSQESGGTYLRAQADDADLDALMNNLEQFEREKFENKRMPQLQERYPWFAAASWFCLAMEWLL